MRRDYFTLTLHDAGATGDQPELRIDFDGPSETLDQRLTEDVEEIDVAFRLQTALDDDDATGVFSITERITGEFLLEVNVDAETVFDLVDAAREYGQQTSDTGGCYCVQLLDDGEPIFEAQRRTLLVYDSDGSLLRQHSLIPSGVEL